jgi:hypothetical protein
MWWAYNLPLLIGIRLTETPNSGWVKTTNLKFLAYKKKD